MLKCRPCPRDAGSAFSTIHSLMKPIRIFDIRIIRCFLYWWLICGVADGERELGRQHRQRQIQIVACSSRLQLGIFACNSHSARVVMGKQRGSANWLTDWLTDWLRGQRVLPWERGSLAVSERTPRVPCAWRRRVFTDGKQENQIVTLSVCSSMRCRSKLLECWSTYALVFYNIHLHMYSPPQGHLISFSIY